MAMAMGTTLLYQLVSMLSSVCNVRMIQYTPSTGISKTCAFAKTSDPSVRIKNCQPD